VGAAGGVGRQATIDLGGGGQCRLEKKITAPDDPKGGAGLMKKSRRLLVKTKGRKGAWIVGRPTLSHRYEDLSSQCGGRMGGGCRSGKRKHAFAERAVGWGRGTVGVRFVIFMGRLAG